MKNPKQEKTVPLTKRLLERSGVRAGKKAAILAMSTAGYVIKAQDGWIVKEDQSGNITKLSEIKKTSVAIKLD